MSLHDTDTERLINHDKISQSWVIVEQSRHGKTAAIVAAALLGENQIPRPPV